MVKVKSTDIELNPEIFAFKSDDYTAVETFTTPEEVLSAQADFYLDILNRAYQPRIEAVEEGARIKINKARTKGKKLKLIKQRDLEIEVLLAERDAEHNKFIWREMDRLVMRKDEQGRGRPSEKGRFLTDLMREVQHLHAQGMRPTQERIAERLSCTERNIRERLSAYNINWRTFIRQCIEYKAEEK